MNLFTKALHSLKAFQMTWSGQGGAGWRYGGGEWANTWISTPGSTYDYATAAGDLRLNTVCQICLSFIKRTFPEPRLTVRRLLRDGSTEVVSNHPSLTLFASPNPHFSGMAIWQAMIDDFMANGNAYFVKARNPLGRPAGIWNVPASQLKPAWPETPTTTEFITHYVHTVNGKETVVPVEDVIHFRFGCDPDNPRLGWSPWRAGLRDIATDNEGSEYEGAILRNTGVASGVLAGKDAANPIPEHIAKAIKNDFQTKFTGSRRGEVGVVPYPVDFLKAGMTPEEMALGGIRDRPEDRIPALIGLSAMVLGLTSGANAKTYANMKEAREAAFEQCIIPMQTLMAADLTRQLMPDFGDDPQQVFFEWDYSQVRVLQEDVNALWARATLALEKKAITLNECRELLGFPPQEGGDRTALELEEERQAQFEQQQAARLEIEEPETSGDRRALAAGKSLEDDEEEELDWLEALTGVKHQPGRHDQRRHGNWAARRRATGGGEHGHSTDQNGHRGGSGAASGGGSPPGSTAAAPRERAPPAERPAPASPAGKKAKGKVSESLDIPSGEHAEPARTAVAAIDKVHRTDDLPKIPVRVNNDQYNAGTYLHGQGRASHIEVSAVHARSSGAFHASHEIGHFIDHQILGERGKFASEEHPDTAKLMKTLEGSASVKQLRSIRNKDNVYAVDQRGVSKKHKVDKKYVEYSLRRREIFARAYAQYIATRSGNKTMKQQLIAQQKGNSPYSLHWKDAEFAPIAAEFDALFAKKGWK